MPESQVFPQSDPKFDSRKVSHNSCLVIAGEKSGEEHAMNFLPELIQQFPEIHFYGVGGDLLKNHGVELIYHLKDFSSFGFSEVIKKIPFYFRAMKNIVSLVEKRKTRIAILIDFQDFNMSLAKKLKRRGVKILYYVAPQAWAWKKYRTKTISECTSVLYSILPFEVEWFKHRGVKHIESVPHPLIKKYADSLKNFKSFRSFRNLKRTIKHKKKFHLLLLPGSRNSEVKYLLPLFMGASLKIKEKFDVKISIVKTTSVNEKYYQYYNNHFDNIYYSENLEQALIETDICIASSGTVTLTTGLFYVPTIVCYDVSLLNRFIFESFVNYQGFISLTNLILGKEIFPELIGESASVFNIVKKVNFFMENKNNYNDCVNELVRLRESMACDVSGNISDADTINSMAQFFKQHLKENFEENPKAP